jgi:pyruvate/2-oxoglutarate/acetoin dehydrogenase E1 component
VLNRALHEVFARRDDVCLIGEDVLDPYGGAFKVTRGLSERWPDRVVTTPISEASLVGITAGMALRGFRPILEIMFGDFLTLGLDQVVNGISKFPELYEGHATLPLVIRTPMGGRRSYGPTHSQSLEKMLLGVPNICMVAVSECHDLVTLVADAVDDDRPVFLIENKLMYGRPHRRPVEGWIDGFRCREAAGRYPALTLTANDAARPAATIATYGGMLPLVLDAATALMVDHELPCEVVALARLLPLDAEPVLDSVARTGRLVTVEEGTLTGGIGAEIAAVVQERAWSALVAPVHRVAAPDRIIPAAPALESAMLPGAEDVAAAVLGLTRGRAHA